MNRTNLKECIKRVENVLKERFILSNDAIIHLEATLELLKDMQDELPWEGV